MPMINKISAKIVIDGTQESVFSAVTNWTSQRNWIFATKVKSVGDGSHKIGGKLEAFTGIGSIGFLDTMTITKWDPPTLCEVTHTGKVLKGAGLFEVVIDNNKTYFIWTEYAKIPFGIIGKIGWYIIYPIMKLLLKISLRRFKRYYMTLSASNI